ncbi:hypothetical protein ELY33_09315 [Vreelandella andesensis]|uniref:Uncharacterized protein n=1 Tax=Vreelandella andesensis TaxID=447567 RepID=A0A433KN01_9GAMM|nr:hypothetical protein [Halomonas andesensis]RUR30991.1 hypothetical protein ELY33_09315 [Halomonas andesensis]
MSAHDQAAGLRKWADLQRQQHQTQSAESEPAEGVVAAEPLTAPTDPSTLSSVPQKPLVVIGMPNGGDLQVARVKGRLAQWSALGRRWAGDPDDWEIHIVSGDAANLGQLNDRFSRWALWINSDADAFSQMYRSLRQIKENGGPRQLLALHEPNLPRRGLLDNLREAASYYLDIELLLLAR